MAALTRLACALSLLPLVSIAARAQTCLGFPAFATGPVNVSGSVSIGTEWWGAGAHANLGHRAGGLFGGASAGTIRFVDDPVESRISAGLLGGYDRMTGGQLHICPFATAAYERGGFVTRLDGDRSKISGQVLGIGIAFAGEQQSGRFRSFSVAPYISARFTYISTHEQIQGEQTTKSDETGASVVGGLGFRLRDAIQITPSFSTSTFENADLVFTLKVSVALQPRR
jgi:hypothetical protein